MTEAIGYLLALFIGISLGLIGGGGSILALPVLVYVFQVETITATAYSLFIVGTTSAVASGANMLKKNIDLKAGILFSIPSLFAVFVTRKFIIPILPEVLFHSTYFDLTKDKFIFLIFGSLMLLAGFLMITGKCLHCGEEPTLEKKTNYPLILLEGFIVGAVTGIVGAGGGFLVIPALVMYAGIPMRLAVGTSLLIIAIKSLTGFIGDFMNLETINWKLLLFFTSIAIAGMLFGNRFQEKFSDKALKKIFGWFITLLAIGILIKEII